PLLAYVLFINKKINAGMEILEHVENSLKQGLLQTHFVQAINVPGLEEDSTLLESRLNLLRYAEEKKLVVPRREELWNNYQKRFTDELQELASAPRERRRPMSLRDWEQLD